MESEKDTERYLNQEMVKIGGSSFKWVCPSVRGVPDRICIFPSGEVIFVEVKSEGDSPKPHQVRVHGLIRKSGGKVFIVETKNSVDKLIELIRSPTFW